MEIEFEIVYNGYPAPKPRVPSRLLVQATSAVPKEILPLAKNIARLALVANTTTKSAARSHEGLVSWRVALASFYHLGTSFVFVRARFLGPVQIRLIIVGLAHPDCG